MARRKTNEEFKKEVNDLTGGEYIFMEEYINSATKIMCKHCVCGYEWSVKPNSFINGGSRCPKCIKAATAKKLRKTNKQFTDEVRSLVGDEYIFLEDYVNTRTMIKCRHSECGHEWEITPGNFLQGRRCPLCFGGALRTNEQFKKKVFDLVGSEYEFIEKYIDTKTKIECKHNKCGHVWEIRPKDFLRGTRCPQCNRPNYNRDTKQFKQEVCELTGDEYSVIGEYVGALTKVDLKHNECGHIWSILPSNFLQGNNRCPQCNISKGEQAIKRYLKNDHIKFQREYSFDDLVGLGGNPLRYDFAIFNSKNNLVSLIEYDGEFHFKEYYESQNFKTLQVHDQRKDQYCIDNNIPLLRIPYWEFDNIEKILNKRLANI